ARCPSLLTAIGWRSLPSGLIPWFASKYLRGMKSNSKSSITLPPEELKLVLMLQAKLKAKSKVEVVRRGLRPLKETTDRGSLREAYRRASLSTRGSLELELEELDHL